MEKIRRSVRTIGKYRDKWNRKVIVNVEWYPPGRGSFIRGICLNVISGRGICYANWIGGACLAPFERPN